MTIRQDISPFPGLGPRLSFRNSYLDLGLGIFQVVEWGKKRTVTYKKTVGPGIKTGVATCASHMYVGWMGEFFHERPEIAKKHKEGMCHLTNERY